MAHALTSSSLVTEAIAASRAARDERLATRRASLTGVSAFPRLQDEPLDRSARPADPNAQTTALPRRRDAELFEALRDRSRAHAAQSGSAPTVLLAALGARRDFGARETFTTALLGVGGIDVHLVEGTDPAVFAAALKDLPGNAIPVAVICSSPAQNAEHGAAVAQALREAGARSIYLAGRSRELAEGDQGLIDHELYDGMDVVAGLGVLLDELEVRA